MCILMILVLTLRSQQCNMSLIGISHSNTHLNSLQTLPARYLCVGNAMVAGERLKGLYLCYRRFKLTQENIMNFKYKGEDVIVELDEKGNCKWVYVYNMRMVFNCLPCDLKVEVASRLSLGE